MAAASGCHHDCRVRSCVEERLQPRPDPRTVRLVALGHLDRRHGLKGLRQVFEPAAAFLALGQVRVRTRGVAGLLVVVHHHVFFREVDHGFNSPSGSSERLSFCTALKMLCLAALAFRFSTPPISSIDRPS